MTALCKCGCGIECFQSYQRGHNLRIKNPNPYYNGGISRIDKFCKDCSKKIFYKSFRCKSCQIKFANTWNKRYLDEDIVRLYIKEKFHPMQIMSKLGASKYKVYAVLKEKQIERHKKRQPFDEEYKRKNSEAKKNFFLLYPEKHPNRISAKRGTMSKIERTMARALSNRNIDFRYNERIGSYYPDFIVFPERIIIECDGKYWHRNSKQYELMRDSFLESEGFKVYRFGEDQINEDVLGCLNKIREFN